MFLRNTCEFYQIPKVCIPKNRIVDSYHFEDFKYHKGTLSNIYFFQEFSILRYHYGRQVLFHAVQSFKFLTGIDRNNYSNMNYMAHIMTGSKIYVINVMLVIHVQLTMKFILKDQTRQPKCDQNYFHKEWRILKATELKVLRNFVHLLEFFYQAYWNKFFARS